MSREDHQMKIRIPDDLKSRIEESASKSGRTLNAEVVFRLERAYSEVDTEFKHAEQRFAEALVMQRHDSLRSQWRVERTRVYALRDRLDRLRRSKASKEDIDDVNRELALAEADLKDLVSSLIAVDAELKKLAASPRAWPSTGLS